jgi:hypothetical protein
VFTSIHKHRGFESSTLVSDSFQIRSNVTSSARAIVKNTLQFSSLDAAGASRCQNNALVTKPRAVLLDYAHHLCEETAKGRAGFSMSSQIWRHGHIVGL